MEDVGPRAHAEERFHIEASVDAILTSAQPSRSELHQLLDACLDLSVLGGSAFNKSAATDAGRRIGKLLVEAALGWTEPQRPLSAPAWADLESDPRRWREEVWLRLTRAPTPLPSEIIGAVMLAFMHADQGDAEAHPLMSPSPRKGYGRNPELARDAEAQICGWVGWRIGSGTPAGVAMREVMEAIGKGSSSPTLVERWRATERGRISEREGRARAAAGLPPSIPLNELADRLMHFRQPDKGRRKAT